MSLVWLRVNADPCQEVAYPTKMEEKRKRAVFQLKATRSQADAVMSLEEASQQLYLVAA